jgi:hypothetical protein
MPNTVRIMPKVLFVFIIRALGAISAKKLPRGMLRAASYEPRALGCFRHRHTSGFHGQMNN